MPKACFFTVCGGQEDYEFLLAVLEHHSKLGRCLVLDTTPPSRQRHFRFLPRGVVWIHEPDFGAGWKTFRCRHAVARASQLARNFGDVVVYTDSDEFWSPVVEELFETALGGPVEVRRTHWKRDGNAYLFKEPEWHVRLWPANEEVYFPVNDAWLSHKDYDGNSDRHPVACFRPGLAPVRSEMICHHHVHHLVGKKAEDDMTARSTIADWDQGEKVGGLELPRPLALWKDFGVKPSLVYE